MPMLMLEGWILDKAPAKGAAALKDEDKASFFVNTTKLGVLRPCVHGTHAGYVFKVDDDYCFVPMAQAEMAQMVRMAINEAPGA